MFDIKKRDGSYCSFDKSRIITAINKAFLEVDGQIYETDTAEDIADEIQGYLLADPSKRTVESIQDLVEKLLMESERKDVAKSYIRYRYKKEVSRNYSNDFIKAIREKLDARNIQNQNANVDEASFGGRTGEASGAMTKRLALDYICSNMAKWNHEHNRIYIHDLDSYYVGSHNCLSIPFDDLLANGFNTRQTDVRPARSVNTACQLVAVIFQLQSLQQFGGVAATHIDWTMVPYIRKSFMKHFLIEYIKDLDDFYTLGLMDMSAEDLDDWIDENKDKYLTSLGLEEKDFRLSNAQGLDKVYYQKALFDTKLETYQAVEALYHNLNTLQSRSGNQLPFTSLNYGTCTSPEGRMMTRALLEVSIKGIGKLHKTSVFPCGIFQYMKGVNDKPGTPNYDLYRLALQSTAKRLYPNYANVDWSNNAGYDPADPTTYFSTMGCRTANLYDINGLGQKKDGRGNICPVTIILPTLAMEARELVAVSTDDYPANLVETFLGILDKAIYEAKDMLIERFEWICSQSPDSAKFMYENNVMAGYVPEEGIRSALKHGTLAMGQIALAETLQLLIGKDHTTPEGMEVAKQIEQLFKTRCAQFKELYKLNFGVYYTPAENLCHTSLKKFKEKYGIIPNVSDREYFTNSMHVPVWKEISAFDKIDIESQLTGYSSAGCITYVELDSTVKNNIDALEVLVNYAMDKDVPYFAVNLPNDTCMSCGYTDELNAICPECGGQEIQRLRRVTGYLTGNYTTAFNKGKIAEVKDRVKHGGGSCDTQES